MECSDIRDEYFDKQIKPCCLTCHEDDDIGYGNDLWFIIEGKERNVCCAIANSLLDSNKKS